MLDKLVTDADKELLELARRSNNSVLRERGYTGMSTLNFAEIVTALQNSCPTVYSFLSRMIQLDINSDKKVAPLVLIYAILLFTRCKNLSRVQRVNTVLLTEGDASHEVYCLHVIYIESIIFTLYVTKLQVWISRTLCLGLLGYLWEQYVVKCWKYMFQ